MVIKNLVHSRVSLISNLMSLIISQSHDQSYLSVLLYSRNIDTSMSPSNCHFVKCCRENMYRGIHSLEIHEQNFRVVKDLTEDIF